jgi:hypothetical protein
LTTAVAEMADVIVQSRFRSQGVHETDRRSANIDGTSLPAVSATATVRR